MSTAKQLGGSECGAVLKKTILSFLLFGAVLGASPIGVSLLNAGNGAIDSSGRYYVGPYTLTLNGVPTPAMCMDDFVEDQLGDKWSANVTRATSSNYSNTYLGNSGGTINGQAYSSTQIYKDEAYLFSLIIQQGSDQADIQEAAWVIMDPTNSTYSSLVGVQSYLLKAINNSPSFNASGFNIVSDVTKFGAQEFMVSATPTPEPASIALVGCGLLAAGAIRLRRKSPAVKLSK